MDASDCQALLALISDLRRQAAAKFGVDAIIVNCLEVGRDGFWLHRLLLTHGVINHVVEPTSILVNRGARPSLRRTYYAGRGGGQFHKFRTVPRSSGL
jgi:transposase